MQQEHARISPFDSEASERGTRRADGFAAREDGSKTVCQCSGADKKGGGQCSGHNPYVVESHGEA